MTTGEVVQFGWGMNCNSGMAFLCEICYSLDTGCREFSTFEDFMAIITHPFKPIIYKDSQVLILGTFPSPKSRETHFYYGHPQNCFWRVLAEVFDDPSPLNDVDSKTDFLKKHNIALWDVLHSCEISGSSDSSIKNPVANKFRPLLAGSSIKAIFTNGKKATALFTRLCETEAGVKAHYLPSTSPANRARYSETELLKRWSVIRELII